MATHVLTGTRIRDRRLQVGLKQADLARAAEISPSYLNLIEHNRRRIGGGILVRIATVLETDTTTLSEGGDAALLDGLRAVAAEETRALEVADIDALVARFPGWANQIVAQQELIKSLEDTVRGLDDRLTHDPVLSQKMHDVLGAVAAIRSTSSILVETPNIDADWRARFHANIDAESRKLAETSAAMAEHFDRMARDEEAYLTPLETLSRFFEQRGFHVAELEEGDTLTVDQLLDRCPELATPNVRDMATQFLSIYHRDAAKMPLLTFLKSAASCNFDPARLAVEYNVSLPAAFRRLASLPRAANLPEIGLVSCDAAGAIMLRKQPAGFALPRLGAACPLWPLFAALRSPGIPHRQLLRSAEGVTYLGYAFAASRPLSSFDEPPTVESVMLLVAQKPETEGNPLTVGPSCRLCSNSLCSTRREPSLLEQLEPIA